MSSSILISVVICTYNRVDILKLALESVCGQEFPKYLYEIVVVDNHSSDHTQAVVEAIQQQYPETHIHLVTEPIINLSQARNTGLSHAQGQYIAFLDDDAKAGEQWLARAQAIIQKHQPNVFGGGSLPYYLQDKPHWFLDAYGTHQLVDSARMLSREEPFIYGHNMVFDRRIFEHVGGFDTDLGMRGDSIGYAEETELIYRIWDAYTQPTVYYDPSFVVYHLVKADRMNLWRLMHIRFIKGRYLERINQQRSRQQITTHIIKLMMMSMMQAIWQGFIFRDRRQYRYWQNYVYEVSLERIGWLGQLVEAWGKPRHAA